MKQKSPTKKNKDAPLEEGRTITKDEAGHVIEELYGFHIISPDDIEHHSGASKKKSDGAKQKTDSSKSQTKSKDDSAEKK